MGEPNELSHMDLGALMMAVVDGEASERDERRLRASVASDRRLAADAEVYALTGRNLGKLFDGILAEPVPGQLIHTVLTAGRERGAAMPTRSGTGC